MAVLRSNFLGGTITADISSGATSHTMAGWANLPTVTSPDILKLTLGSEIPALGGAPEIVYVTAHSAASTTITISRAQEGTSARAHLAATAESWRHAPTAFDHRDNTVFIDDQVVSGYTIATAPTTAARTACIQAAFDAVNAMGGGVVTQRSPGTTYTVDVTQTVSAPSYALKVYSNTTVTGLNLKMGTAYQDAYPIKWLMIGATDTVENIRIFDCEFDGANVDTTVTNEGGSCIGIQGAGWWVERNHIHHFTGTAIKNGENGTTTASKVFVNFNWVHDCAGGVVRFGDVDNYEVIGNIGHDAVDWQSGGAESIIMSTDCSNGKIKGNIFVDWGSITVFHSDCDVEGNAVRWASAAPGIQAAITISGVSGVVNNVTVRGNDVDVSVAGNGVGILVDLQNAGNNIAVNDNDVKRYATASAAGIQFNTYGTCAKLRACDNTIWNGVGTTAPDIHVQQVSGTLTNVRVNDNTLASDTSGIIIKGATDAAADGNVIAKGSIFFADCTRPAASGNSMWINTSTPVYGAACGIGLSSTTKAALVGNAIDCSTDVQGVLLSNSTDNLVAGNNIITDNLAAVVETGTSDRNTIGPNHRTGTKTVTLAGANSYVRPISKRVTQTAGSYTVNSNLVWANLDTGLDLTIPAAISDWVQVEIIGCWNSEAVHGYLDVVSVVSGSPVNSWSKDGAPVNGAAGVLAWLGPSGVIMGFGGSISKKIVSGDLSSGNVTLRIRCQTSAATNKTLFASADNPLIFIVRNLSA